MAQRLSDSVYPYAQPVPRVAMGVARAARAVPSARVTALSLALITALAGVLRVWHGAAQSLRLDEGFTLRWMAAPLQPVLHGHTVVAKSLFQVAAADVHPPGYFLFLHFWIAAFGASLPVIRLPSEIAGTLAVPALFLFGSVLYGRSVGLLAALMGALSPFWIWHAQEARMYPLLLLFTLLSSYALVEAVKNGRQWGWILYVVSSLLAIYTQYYAFLVLLAHGVFLLSHYRSFRARQIAAWFGAMAALALCYLPWALMLLANYRGAADPSLQAPTLYTPLIMLSTFLFGYLSTPITSNVIAAWPLLVVAALALGVFAAAVNRRASFLWLLFLLPVVLAFAVTLTVKPVFSVRYLMIATPPLYVLLAVALDRLRGGITRSAVVAGIALLSLAAWHIGEVSAANPETENYRAAARYLAAHVGPKDVVGLDSFYNQDAFSYYSRLNVPLYDLPFTPNSATGAVPAVTTARFARYFNSIAAGHRYLWVVYYLESNYDRHNLVRHYLAYNTAGHEVIFGGPYGRDQETYPRSYISVQLVRYTLIPRPAGSLQARPETTQDLRAVTRLSPSLRYPMASPFGKPGASAPLIGRPLAPPAPLHAWLLTSVPAGQRGRAVITIGNPNQAAVQATITDGAAVKQVTVPRTSDVEVSRDALNGASARGQVLVRSTGFITVQRRVFTPTAGELENARPARAGA